MIVGQDENKSMLQQAIQLELPVLLIGETGTGKTSIIRELAEEQGKELIRINLTGQTSTDEFLGKWLIKNQETVWVDGALVTAMKNGYWIVIDEINVALPEILFALHSLLDDHRAIMLSEKDGEVVKPHKNFRLFATMNPTADYSGTKELNKAFLSRFAMVLYFDYPTPANEVKILKQYSNKEKDLQIIVDFANRLRGLKKQEVIFYTCSTRDLIQWVLLMGSLGVEQAFSVTILNKADMDKETILNEYNQMFEPVKNSTRSYAVRYVNDIFKKIQDKETALKEKETQLLELQAEIDKAKEKIVKELVDFKVTEKVSSGVEKARHE